jgi:hypothetical protein
MKEYYFASMTLTSKARKLAVKNQIIAMALKISRNKA